MRLVRADISQGFEFGEASDPQTPLRIVPLDELDRDALAKIWQLQQHRGWRLDDREIPFDSAEFSGAIKWQDNGFAVAEVHLRRDKFDPLSGRKSLSATIFWLWEPDGIQSYWSIDQGDFHSAQTNQAQYPIVFA